MKKIKYDKTSLRGRSPKQSSFLLFADIKKSWIATGLALAMTILTPLCHAKTTGEQLDKIVAIVNDDVVTQSELNRSLLLSKAQASQEGASSKVQLKDQVLDDLINKKLQLQIAKQVGIHFNEEEIDRIIKNIADKNNVSVSALYERISSEGMSATEYRDELREQMTIQKLQQQEVASRLVITPDEIKNFMRGKVWASNTNREYHLEDMLIPLSDTPSGEEVKSASNRAELAITNLSQGKTAADLSKNDLGWRKLPEIPSIFAEHVAKMQVNEIVGPIRAPNGFHILRLLADRSAGSADTPDKNKVEQLLLQRKFQENVQHWVSKMRSQAYISKNVTT